MRKKTDKYYSEQAEKILKQAERDGVLDNFLFMTTFERYLDKVERLRDIEKELTDSGYTIEKTYNGSTNEVASPAYRNYIAICDSLDRTVSTLLKVTREFKKGIPGGDDPLLDILNGGDADD